MDKTGNKERDDISKQFNDTVDWILPSERERGLLDQLKSQEGSPDTRAAGIQALVRPFDSGMVGNFGRLLQNTITANTLLATVGTPLYPLLQGSLCRDVSARHVTDYQRFTICLDCKVVAAKSSDLVEPWLTLAKIDSADSKKWLTSAREHLAKYPGWLDTVAIRPVGFYLVRQGIRTERELRIHLGFRVPERTFSTTVAGLGKRFKDVPQEKAATMTKELVESAPVICTSIIADIDRYIEQSESLNPMSTEQKIKIQTALARASERVGGVLHTPSLQSAPTTQAPSTVASIQVALTKMSIEERGKLLAEFPPAPLEEPTWEVWLEKLPRFLKTDEQIEKIQRVQAVINLLGVGDTLPLLVKNIEQILPNLTELERKNAAEDLSKILRTIGNGEKARQLARQKAIEAAIKPFPFAAA